MRLAQVIEQLVEERGLDKDILSDIVVEGMLSAYQKKYPDLELRIRYNKSEDELVAETQKQVVASVQDDELEVSLRKARGVKKTAELDDKIWLPFDGKIGRIEVLRAKQVIAQKIRAIESAAVFEEFKDKEGTIVHGVIHKSERGGIVVKLQDQMAFLPKSLSIPGDKCIVGYPIRALLKDVLPEPRNDNQLILDRASEEFVERLFELEVPEVFEKLVEIKRIARSPGYKSKLVVVSNDQNIDPVGTCVGVGGIRIKPILKELGGEKIDVIAETDSIEELVQHSLKPAKINRVVIDDDGSARVWLDEDQRSFAIGKSGQNIALASRLSGVQVHLMDSEKTEDADIEFVETASERNSKQDKQKKDLQKNSKEAGDNAEVSKQGESELESSEE